METTRVEKKKRQTILPAFPNMPHNIPKGTKAVNATSGFKKPNIPKVALVDQNCIGGPSPSKFNIAKEILIMKKCTFIMKIKVQMGIS